MSTQSEKREVKQRILEILEDGKEYDRVTLSKMAVGHLSFVTPAEAEKLVVQLDVEDDALSVRIDGSGVAWYSKGKAKDKTATPGLSAGTGPDIHQRNRRVKPVAVESVVYGPGVKR